MHHNIKRYIHRHFISSFYTIFLPFLTIVSLVFLIRISILTSKIQITFAEMLELFVYYLPDILYYTIPLSFVTALGNTFTKLSSDNELIALHALGLKSYDVLKHLFYLGFMVTLFLFTLSYAGMTLGYEYSKQFIHKKKTQPTLNLNVGELGQKFGELYIYVEDKNDSRYKNMVIYNRTKKDEEQFFVSKEGELNEKEHSNISLKLYDGYGYTYLTDGLKQAQYETLEVFHEPKSGARQIRTLSEFWSQKRNQKKGCFYFFINFVPLTSIFFIAAFTMINPRYHKNISSMVIFGTLLFMYTIAAQLENSDNLFLPLPAVIATFFLGHWFFRKRVVRYF
jgi:lipopolysaccharide export system permease protein